MDNSQKRIATSDKAANRDNSRLHFNSTAAQRKRLYQWLMAHGMIDTLTARRDLDILAPAARVWELKHRFGKMIDKVMITRPTDCGKLHRVALYVLRAASEA